MNTLLRLVLFLTAAQIAVAAATSPKDREEAVFIFQNRKVSILVPEGFGYSLGKDEHGLLTVTLTAAKEQAALLLTFMPVAPDRFKSTRDRKDFMVANFQAIVAGSVEKAMRFEELEPKIGAATYCVFTDAALVDRPVKPGEYLYLTPGIKTWPGVVVVFSLLSRDTMSKEYAAALRVLRDSVHEQPMPPK